MKRAVVTGITGQDGSYLSERLIRDGWEVHALVRPEQTFVLDERVVRHGGDLALVRMSVTPTPNDFVIATGDSHSIKDFVAAAFQAVGIEDWERLVTTSEEFSRPNDAAEMVGDATMARAVLGWQPQVSFDEIVARMVASDLEDVLNQKAAN